MCPAMVTLCVRSGSVTMWWSKVLFCTTKYYCVLQSTTPVLLCTTQYYNVLLQYYSVLQSTTPVLLCTAKYYSSTTLYYKVLLQYYSVLQSTTPVLLGTTQYYSSTTPVLLCTTKDYSSTTRYYKVLLQYYSVLQSTTPVLLCTTQYYSSTTPVLFCTAKYYSSTTLYFKAAFMIDPSHIWTAIYIARSNRSHPPTPPNTAPATQNDCDDWSASHMKRHWQCAEQQESQSNFTKYCTCHAKWISWLIRVSHETSFTMRGGTGITIQLHQIPRLPCKMNLMIDPHQIWNVIYNARSNQSHPPTAANTAPATQTHSHDSSSSHMKRHLQCAEQHCFPSNTTKYCACYEILSSRCQRKIPELLPPIERRFDDNPTTIHLKIASRTRRFGDLTRPTSNTILYWKIQHFALRLPPKMSPNAAPATKSHTPTSPNTAPATQNESHDWSASHMKRHLECAEQAKSTSNLTKYCPCHAKWISWLIRVTYETSFPMRRASKVNLQPHQILRLPRNL